MPKTLRTLAVVQQQQHKGVLNFLTDGECQRLLKEADAIDMVSRYVDRRTTQSITNQLLRLKSSLPMNLGRLGLNVFTASTVSESCHGATPGTPGTLQEPPGTSRSLREPAGASRSLQESPAVSRNLQEPPGASRTLQEPPGASRSLRV